MFYFKWSKSNIYKVNKHFNGRFKFSRQSIFNQVVEYKNIQRRVYDAIHVLLALGYLIKIDNNLYYNFALQERYKEIKAKSSASEKYMLKFKNSYDQKKKILNEKTIQVNYN